MLFVSCVVRVLIKGVRDGTEYAIRENQYCYGKGGGCSNQVFPVRLVCEKYL